MTIRENVPISTLTTMRLGGPARYVVEIHKQNDIRKAYQFAKDKNLPTIPMGIGSNFVGKDEGFEGVILLNKLKGIDIIDQDDSHADIRAASGEILDDLCAFSVEHNLSGIEMMSGIPGTVGAAPIQNSGAYGQDTSNTLTHIEVYDHQTNEFKTLPLVSTDEFKFAYRHSVFNTEDRGRYLLLSVTFRLSKKQSEPPFFASLQAYLDDSNITDYSPRSLRDAVRTVRDSKLPDPAKIPSAGSFFKNIILTPEEEILFKEKWPDAPIFPVQGEITLASGWLIDQCGLKGKTLHGMTVNDQAALVLMNTSATSYADLAKAREEIREAVRNKFDITLTQEPEEI